MAVGWVFFSAQKSHAELSHSTLEALNSGRKHRIAYHPAIDYMSLFVVVSGIVRAAAQFAAKKHIADSAFAESLLENFAVELGCEARVRCGASVCDYIDLLAHQKIGELLPRVGGMTDSEHNTHWRLNQSIAPSHMHSRSSLTFI
jgi:hypothetical protein